MKAGDYGTGGRVYVQNVNSRNSSSVSCASVVRVIFLYIPLVLFVGVALYCEWHRSTWLEQLNDVWARPHLFVRDGKVAVDGLVDDYFGWELPPGCVSVSRHVEYCQWQETRHRRTDGETEVTSFSYVKGWVPHLVNSALFDASVAYSNPTRDIPFPRILGARATVDGRPISDSRKLPVKSSAALFLEPWHYDRLRNSHAWNFGFRRMDASYAWAVFEDVSPTSYAEQVARGAAQFYLDGVVGTGVKGVCEPGDIRVSFKVNYAPQTVSVALDEQGQVLFAREGDISLEKLLEEEAQIIVSWVTWSRRAVLFFLVASAFAWRYASLSSPAVEKKDE